MKTVVNITISDCTANEARDESNRFKLLLTDQEIDNVTIKYIASLERIIKTVVAVPSPPV